jgi:hypothetical protein
MMTFVVGYVRQARMLHLLICPSFLHDCLLLYLLPSFLLHLPYHLLPDQPNPPALPWVPLMSWQRASPPRRPLATKQRSPSSGQSASPGTRWCSAVQLSSPAIASLVGEHATLWTPVALHGSLTRNLSCLGAVMFVM